jgi:hypothetical protein
VRDLISGYRLAEPSASSHAGNNPKEVIGDGQGAGILWSSDSGDTRELSAAGVLSWNDREEKPSGAEYVWVGFSLLCNAAPDALCAERREVSIR